MAQDTAAPAKAPFLPGSILWQRKGPLPVWAWALVGLALVFVIMWWRRNRAEPQGGQGYYRDELPGDQGAPPIFVMPPSIPPNVTVPITVQPPATVPPAPPGGGAGPPTVLPSTAVAPAGKNLYEWIDELNTANPGLAFNFGKLDLYNPNWRNTSGLYWESTPGNPNAKTPKLKSSRSFRIR